jgi:hypothetical protein
MKLAIAPRFAGFRHDALPKYIFRRVSEPSIEINNSLKSIRSVKNHIICILPLKLKYVRALLRSGSLTKVESGVG